ncbi:MAG: PilZ domain-containing protein [Dissulfuribacterales bacterium]
MEQDKAVTEGRRRNIRAPFHTEVWISVLDTPDENEICIPEEQTHDISLRGIYCVSSYKLPVGTMCMLSFYIQGQSKPEFSVKARVARVDENGMGFEFVEMTLEDLTFLKNLMYYNTGDPERVDQEMLLN